MIQSALTTISISDIKTV